jgi:hypothetical protein
MKKHPVDDLFKRKLTNLEKRPLESAWLRIQEQQQPKVRVAGWLWYAAASAVLALFAGYLIWQNNQTRIDAAINNVAVTGKLPEKGRMLPEKPITEIAKLDQKTTLQPKSDEKIASKDLIDEHLRERNVAVENKPDVNVMINKPSELAELRIEQPEEKNANYPASPLSNLPEVQSLRESAMKETNADALAKIEVEPARTIVVAITPAEETEDQPKTSKFSRVFRQLKNARAGEKVDWEEVGFNPKSLVARVDDRLRSKEERSSEKYENPKDRTKL